ISCCFLYRPKFEGEFHDADRYSCGGLVSNIVASFARYVVERALSESVPMLMRRRDTVSFLISAAIASSPSGGSCRSLIRDPAERFCYAASAIAHLFAAQFPRLGAQPVR
ncbi:MAG: hypothetical protein KGK01_14470, partial [Bradyrhizobium sp.]|nr:hypothetical protein [Bradyrhizobium sp.]